MAVRPDYTIGTLTLTAASADFTTTGSALKTIADVREGDKLITASGHVLKIATITGDNAGTLAFPCPAAAAGAGQPLRVEFQPDGARYSGKTAELIELLGDGNLEEFAGLVGAAGAFPYFDTPNTLALLLSSENGRAILSDASALGASIVKAANAAAIYNALGVVPDAQIPGRLRETYFANQVGDANSVLVTGWFNLVTPFANGPVAGATLIIHYQRDATYAFQFGSPVANNDVYFRSKTVGGWSTWSKMYGTGNTNGNVSQSGGVPTGALFEYGSNSNGEYLRFANKLQICWGTYSAGPGGVANAFPASFVTAPIVNLTATIDIGFRGPTASSITTTSFRAQSWFLSSGAMVDGSSTGGGYQAVGRWFT